MIRNLRRGLMAVCLMALAGCAGSPPAAPEPVKPIDVSQFFTGRWYEIARTPMSLTKGCVAGTTNYFRNSDGQLIDLDACRMNTPDGKVKSFEGPVTILDPGQNNKVSVRYTVWGFIPVWRTYWMLDRANDYQWFIVSNPAFTELSLFTRNPRPSDDTKQMLVRRAQQLGYDTSKLEFPTEFPPGQQ